MNRMLAAVLVAVALLLTVLAGCAPAQPAPSSVTIFDGSRQLQLKPGDSAWATIASQLDYLVAGLDTPLYADYPPGRVEAEVRVRPHLEAVYTPAVTLKGKGYQAEASQLIVAMTAEGPVVLTRVGDANWTASETSDAGRFSALFQAVRDRTGIDLQVPVK